MAAWLPLVQLALLSAFALVVRSRLVLAATPAAAGSSVMAIGIFGLAALQQLPNLTVHVTQPLVIGLLIVWASLASSYVAAARNGELVEYARPLIGRFAIGTWIAATAVLVRMILLGVPEWRPLALLLGVVAVVLWLWFMTLTFPGVQALAGGSFRQLTPGVILLPTISTQSLALAGLDLFPGRSMLEPAAEALIAVGAVFYPVSAVLIVRSHIRTAGWTLKDDWDNSNCTLHGAISITGLAVIGWQFGPPGLADALWLAAFIVFIAVEAIELTRLVARIRAYGLRRGAFSYRVTQWSRNFTFGMFYAFTLALSQSRDFPAERSSLEAVKESILTYGPHVVLFLLLVEIALFVDSRLHRRLSH